MAELPSFDPYLVLGVDKTADATSIKKAYRKLALLKHPDKCTDEALRSARTDEFQRLNEAYDILGDDDKRKRHDALVKLDALRKKKASMSAKPRPFTRSSTFHSGFPTTSGTAYTSRGATNVEDRAPRMSSDEDDYLRFPRRYTDFEFARRSAPPPSRERTKSEKEAAERRKDDRKRDNGIRDARSSKYDYDYGFHPEDDKRSRAKETRSKETPDPLRRKYTDQEDILYKYTASVRSRATMETRPSMGRRSSTRAVPPVQVRRSSATPKESGKIPNDYDERDSMDRERQRREKDEKARRKERERRDRERDEDHEPPSPRRRAENVQPYDQRPPSLQHAKSSPPYAPDEVREPLSRTNTEPFGAKGNTPPIPRSHTMPTVPSNSSSKRAPQPSKLRNSVRQEDADSSSSDSEYERRRRKATPIKYAYTRAEEPVTVEPRSARQTRTVSPEPSRPTSSGAVKMEKLAKLAAAQRPSALHTRSSSGYPLPVRGGRSPDRSARRDRSRERDREGSRNKPLYGEISSETPRRSSLGNVSFGKHIRAEDVVYAQRPATGRREREREPYEGFSHPGIHRSHSIPIQ